MCMITYIPAGVQIPAEGIENGSIFNDDGHGWAVASTNGLFVGKSMKFEESFESFVETREREGMSSLAMFHSRFGTHGIMGEFNVHPFPVGDRGDTVMMHNGVLPAQFHPLQHDARSDTRKFADQIGSYVDNERGIPSRRGGGDLGRIIGMGNKLVFLSVRSGEPKVRIINADAGHWEEGVWYSNDGHRPHYLGRKGKGAGTHYSDNWWNDDDQWVKGEDNIWRRQSKPSVYDTMVCPYCEKHGEEGEVDWVSMTCKVCWTCLDCEQVIDDCLCFTPPSKGEGEANPWTGEIIEGEVLDDEQAEQAAQVEREFLNWAVGVVNGMDEDARRRWVADMTDAEIRESKIASEIMRRRDGEHSKQVELWAAGG